MGYDLNGERMPELRSGARRSKRLGDLQPATQPIEANGVQTAPNKARRRVGGGRGRGGNATAVAKGNSPAVATRRTAAGRGRGGRLVDLVPEPVALGTPEPVLNREEVAANNNNLMAGGSADKVAGAEEEACTTPVPETVISQSMALLV